MAAILARGSVPNLGKGLLPLHPGEDLSTRIYCCEGLRKLSRRLTHLEDFPYTAADQRLEAAQHADKLSIEGIQPKLSVKLNVTAGLLDSVDRGGKFIVKPPHAIFPELPAPLIDQLLSDFLAARFHWDTLISSSFLTPGMRQAYRCQSRFAC